jgi:hypothetical protein
MKGYVEQIGWDLVLGIFRVEEASQPGDISHPNVSDEWRRCSGRPVLHGGNADMRLAPIGSELCKSAEVPRKAVKFKAECLA